MESTERRFGPQGTGLARARLPRPVGSPLPGDRDEFVAKDKGLGIQRELPNLFGNERPLNLERLAQEHPDFAQLDEKLRKPWQEIIGNAVRDTYLEKDVADRNAHGVYAAWLERLQKDYNMYPEIPVLRCGTMRPCLRSGPRPVRRLDRVLAQEMQ